MCTHVSRPSCTSSHTTPILPVEVITEHRVELHSKHFQSNKSYDSKSDLIGLKAVTIMPGLQEEIWGLDPLNYLSQVTHEFFQ